MIKDHVVANELYNYQLMNMWHVHIYIICIIIMIVFVLIYIYIFAFVCENNIGVTIAEAEL